MLHYGQAVTEHLKVGWKMGMRRVDGFLVYFVLI